MPKKILSLALWFAAFGATPAIAADGAPIAAFGDAGLAILTAGDPHDRDGQRIEGTSWMLVPNDAAVDADDRIVIGGYLNRAELLRPDPDARGAVMRMGADGRPDAGFGSDPDMPGVVVLPDLVPGTAEQRVEAVHLLDDGRILVAGTCTAFGPTTGFVLRLLPGGELDPDFAHGGALLADALFHALKVDSHGNILAAGEKLERIGVPMYRGLLARFDAGGAPLSTFELYEPGVDHLSYVLAMQVLPDDRVVLAGTHQRPRTGPQQEFIDNYDLSVARLTVRGELDATFADDGWQVFEIPGVQYDVETIDALEIDTDGALVFAVQAGDSGAGTGTRIGRLQADGAAAPEFGDAATPGFSTALAMPDALNTVPAGLARSPSGHWLVGAGYFGEHVLNQDFLAARFTRDGRPDTRFGEGGIALIDLFHGGAPTDDVRTLLMHDGQPLLIGASVRVHAAREPGEPDALLNPAAVDTAAVKLEHWPLFGDGF